MPGFDLIIENLEPEIPVFVIDETDNKSLIALAKVLGKEAEILEYIQWKKSILDGINDKTKDLELSEKPTVYLKTGWSVDSFMTMTSEVPHAAKSINLSGAINNF